MARKIAADSDDESTRSSQKENISPVKQDKGKKPERAVRRVQQSLVERSTVDEEPTEDASDAEHESNVNANDDNEEEEDEEEQDLGRRKRVRLSEDGDAIVVKPEPSAKAVALPRQADGYTPGSILRITLHNFMSYSDVEFEVGPKLNMIIGPNGAGKSSIACAIALGLNFPTKHLGRAGQVADFVNDKNGATEAFIEIELRGAGNDPNMVIRRHFTSETSKAKKERGASKSEQPPAFTLNGVKVSGGHVSERLKKLNVQCDNLCTFLPQDRVAKFADLKPTEKLREVQRAAGGAWMLESHDILIKTSQDLIRVTEELNDRERAKISLEERNALIEQQVQSFRERKQLELDLEYCELVHSSVAYESARREHTRLKEIAKDKADRMKEITTQQKPLNDLVKKLDNEATRLEKHVNDVRKDFQAIEKKARTKTQAGEDLDTQVEDHATRLSTLRKSEKDRQNRIANHESKIKDFKQQIANPPTVEDGKELSKEVANLTARSVPAKTDLSAAQRALEKSEADVGHQQGIIEEKLGSLERMKDPREQRIMKLRRRHDNPAQQQHCEDTAKACEWLHKNLDKFEGEVFEPICISGRILDPKYLDAVESCITRPQRTTFVFKLESDYKLFNNLLVDTDQAVGRKLRLNTWCRAEKAELKVTPIPNEEIKEMGFDGYAIDFIDYPPGLMYFLQAQCRMNRTPIASDLTSVDLEQAKMRCGSVSGQPLNFIAGPTKFAVKKSAYGRQEISMLTGQVEKAESLTVDNIDPREREKLVNDISGARDALKGLEGVAAGNKAKYNEARELVESHKKEQQKMSDRRDAITAAAKSLQSLKGKLENQRRLLHIELERPSMDEQRANLIAEISDLNRRRVQNARELRNLWKTAAEEFTDHARQRLQLAQLKTNHSAAKSLQQAEEAKHADAVKQANDALDARNNAKERSKDLKDELGELMQVVSELAKERFRAALESEDQLKDMTVEQAEEDRAEAKTRLDLNFATDRTVVDQYENRERQIEELQTKVDGLRDKERKLKKRANKVKDKWYPALQSIVSDVRERFEAAFSQIRCNGSLEIEEDEDYAKWALILKVTFRDNEKLTELSATSQSGGERAVSTIFFLMALVVRTKAPFSLVDEINQGMDPRNERAVHGQFVDVTCNSDCPQYFLLTPKLLPDLKYHKDMKVLCVSNGPWLLDNSPDGDIKRMLDNYERMNGVAGPLK